MSEKKHLFLQIYLMTVAVTLTRNTGPTTGRRLGKFDEVFAWRQLSYDIDGTIYDADVTEDPYGIDIGITRDRAKRQSDSVYFNNDDDEPERVWDRKSSAYNHLHYGTWWDRPVWDYRPVLQSTNRPATASSTSRPADEEGRFFIQYNNVPMGVERVGDKLFVTVPRRRYGIPSTLNYIDLSRSHTMSPPLKPYPNYRSSRTLTSVYRTRHDTCGRLWMVDTGLLEIPDNRQQIQPPAIVVFDVNNDRQIFRYPFKTSDIPSATTPTGLASITVDIPNNDCANAFAYVPDLTTYGLIVYSLSDNDSWRLSHNFFSFNPTAGNLNVAGLRFQWSDGIFSLALVPTSNDCKAAYFHPLVSTQEFSVSTCILRNRTASSDPNYFSTYSILGDRGEGSQSTMHDVHPATRVAFYAEIGRDAISCWNTAESLMSSKVAILAQDSNRLSYPADLHVTGDEVWVMANSLTRFGYTRLDANNYNFYVYRGTIPQLIAGTSCAFGSSKSNML